MRSRMVDSFSERLRQYVAVPADVTPTSASALAVDIRTFPWIRRLALDYAFAFANVAPFYAGDPATSAPWGPRWNVTPAPPRRGMPTALGAGVTATAWSACALTDADASSAREKRTERIGRGGDPPNIGAPAPFSTPLM